MLVPAGILILVLLATLSIDSAIAFAGQRELFDIAAAAAGDAAVLGIDEERYYRCADLVLDPAATRAAATAAVERRGASADLVTVTMPLPPPRIGASDDAAAEPEVTVTLTGTVDPLIAASGPRQLQAFATVAANSGELPGDGAPVPGGPDPGPAPGGPGPAPGGPGPLPGGPGPLDPPAAPVVQQLPLPPQTTTPLVPVPDPSPPLESAPGPAPAPPPC